MAENRDTLFLKIAIQNGKLDPARGERILKSIAERREIGIAISAWDVATELGLIPAAEAEKIRQAVDRALPPERVAGFEIEATIGKGAVGTVYRAKQTSLDKTVAVKVLHPGHTAEERFVADFLREAKSAARLNHPNIVHAIDAGVSDGRYYFAMEYVEGETLRQKLERRGKLSAAEALQIAKQVAAGLAHAHENGLIHRDLKPDNILIGSDGRIRIADLGLAIPIDDAEVLAAEHRKQGTPFYLSPEQARGEEIDARSDLYSLGATLYHCLAGKPVFTGGTVKEILTKHVHQQPVPLAEAAGQRGVLDDVVMRLIEKDPAARFASTAELVAALDRLAAEPAGPRTAAAAPRSRKKAAVARSGREPAAREARTGARRPGGAGGAGTGTGARESAARTARRGSNHTASYVGAGAGGVIAVLLIISAAAKSGASDALPTEDAAQRLAIEARSKEIIAERMVEWRKGHAEKEKRTRERIAEIVEDAEDDSLRRRGLEHLLAQVPDSPAAPEIIAELAKVRESVRAQQISAPAELLARAESLKGEGKLYEAYRLLDRRPLDTKKDREMNQKMDDLLTELENEIDARVVRDMATAKEKRGRKDFDGAIAVLATVRDYADPKSIEKADVEAEECRKDKAEYARAESERRVREERVRYTTVFARYRAAAQERDVKDAISAALEVQAEMSTEEIRGRIETDLNAFALLDQFVKDALAQLEELRVEGKEVDFEMKPIGESPRGRRYKAKIERVEKDTVFIHLDRAIFPLDIVKMTDQTVFDLVLERHGEGSPGYLMPLGVLFLYRGNYDIAKSHFELAKQAGGDPAAWLDHLEYVQKLGQ